jgi:hypothetical protein
LTGLSDYIGNWYAVPLSSGGYASVLVARASCRGVLFGYFFGPRSVGLPAMSQLVALRPESAVLVSLFGDPGITDGGWPLIGTQPGWDSNDWPMPVFVHQDPLVPSRWFASHYPDDDPNGIPTVVTIDADAAAGLPDNGMRGHLLVERVLDAKLRQS